MHMLDEVFNVAPEFFQEYLDAVIEDIRASLILLLPGEFRLVPVPFSKSVSYQDHETDRWYEGYQDVFHERIKKFDIVLENSGIGYVLIEHRKTDSLRVRVYPYARLKEQNPNGKLYPNEGPNILGQLVKELCKIEPGHLSQTGKEQSKPAPKTKKHINPEVDEELLRKEVEAAIEMRKKRLSWTQIAKELNVSVRTLQDHRNKYKFLMVSQEIK